MDSGGVDMLMRTEDEILGKRDRNGTILTCMSV